MSLCESRKAPTREKRLGTLSHYHGTLASLRADSASGAPAQRVRTFSQSTPGEIVTALRVLTGVRDVAVVVHGAAGCAAAFPGAFSCALNESDTILGGDEKLRAALRRAVRGSNPSLVFVVGTPVNAINNDDVAAVIMETEEEFSCPIVYIDVNGFKTKCAATGFDVVYHALLKNVCAQSAAGQPGEGTLNLVSATENAPSLAAVRASFERLGIPCNVLPQGAALENFRAAAAASSSISLDDGENGFFLAGLEEEHGVPALWTAAPIGTAKSAAFFAAAAAVFGKEKEAERLSEEGAEAASPWISKRPFGGGKVFLETDASRLPGLAHLIEELGGVVTGLSLPRLDSPGDLDGLALPGETPVIIGGGQPFELSNALGKRPADFFAGGAVNAPVAAAAGARPVVALYSTFLQRAVDQVIHDVALQNLPVVFAVDRAGFVGGDGETHQGLFDIALFRSVPNLRLLAPAGREELAAMLDWAVKSGSPAVIRYPKAVCPSGDGAFRAPLEEGRGVFIREEGGPVCIAFTGSLYREACEAAALLGGGGVDADLYNLRFLKPVDEPCLAALMSRYGLFVIAEEGVKAGGFGEYAAALCHRLNLPSRVIALGADENFEALGSRDELLEAAGLDGEGIAGTVMRELDVSGWAVKEAVMREAGGKFR